MSDLYETPAGATEELIRTKFADVLYPSQMVICDPCCGHNAILNVFEKHGFQVVGDDLHTHPDKRIFPPIPFYHSFASSWRTRLFPNRHSSWNVYIWKVSHSVCYCLCLIWFARPKWICCFEFGITVCALNTRPHFLHEGKEVQVEEVAWFVYDGIPRDGSDHSRVEVKRCALPVPV